MTRSFTAILICILLGVTAFSVYRFVSATRESFDLTAQVESIHSELSALQDEKDKLLLDLDKEKQLQKSLSDDNLLLTSQVKREAEARQLLEEQVTLSKKEIEDLSGRIAAVQAENTVLAEEARALKTDLAQSVKEREAMAEKMSSVAALKKAIKELRRQTRIVRKRPTPVRTVKNKQTGTTQMIIGNQGFLLRDGKATFEGRVRIDVVPQQQDTRQ